MQQLLKNTLLQRGKYRIEKVLGQGGFGITYLATQELLNRKVAIKEFFYKEYCERDEETSHVSLGTSSNRELVERFMEKFIKEARTISTLNHPHIIRIYDIFKENNTAYYVMEYIEGMSLAEMVKQQGALSEDVAIDYIKQVASALDFVHQHSINHLDVKPANVMVRREDNQTVLIDFGLSKQYDASGEQTSTTPVGISHGYAPMEQYNVGGVGTFSPQTDVYSLGATLYKLVTGNTPPQAIEIFNDELPELPSNLSSSLRECIKKSMQPKKTERYNNVEEFVVSLDRVALTDDDETQIIQVVEPEAVNDKVPWYIIISVLITTLIVIIPNVLLKPVSIDSSTQIIDPLALVEQQRINDSIANVCQQEAEKLKIDSIDVLNEQARLVVIRKLEEERKYKKQEDMVIDKSGYVNGNMAVDLGLSVRWAICNVGASLPEDFGNYFAFGEPTGILYTDNPRDYPTGKIYNSENDMASKNWGVPWRLPNRYEIEELLKCSWTKETRNGIEGYLVKGKNGNSIFLPYAGRKSPISGDVIYNSGNKGPYLSLEGYYWAGESNEMYGQGLNFASHGQSYVYAMLYKNDGCSVRAVTK